MVAAARSETFAWCGSAEYKGMYRSVQVHRLQVPVAAARRHYNTVNLELSIGI